MFFYASKIVWGLLAPLNFIFALFGLGLLCRLISKKIARRVIGSALFLFAVCGFFPVGYNILVYLESAYERPLPAKMPEKIDGILVLGGYFDTRVSAGRDLPSFNSAADRLMDALALYQDYPQAMLVFSGGNGFMIGGEARTEAQDIEDVLKALDVPQESVVFEDRSRNTYQNIIYSRDYIKPRPFETWILVTSAYHMKRAMAVAEAHAPRWRLIPYPADYRTDGRYRLWPRSFDVLGRFDELDRALKEVIGLIAYGITGKTSLPK